MLTNFSSIATTALQAGILKQVDNSKVGVNTLAKDVLQLSGKDAQAWKQFQVQKERIKVDSNLDKAIYGDDLDKRYSTKFEDRIIARHDYLNTPAGKQFIKDNKVGATYINNLQRRMDQLSRIRNVTPQRMEEIGNGENKNGQQ